MTTFLLWLLIFELLALIAWGLMRRDRTFQFPFLAAAGFAGYLLPQIIGLTQEPDLPDGALAKMLLMAILCLAAAYWGYASNRRPARLLGNWHFDHRKLVVGSATLTLLGAFFFYKVSQLAAEASLATGGQWTGVITIYVFFSQLLTFGFVLALILHLKRPSWPTLVIMLFGLAFYLERIVIHGRRAYMIELFLFVVMALWFHRRWAPPRWTVISGIIFGMLIVNSIGDYRSIMLKEDRATWTGAGINEILEIDYWGNLKSNFTQGGFDVTNALFRIEAVEREFAFDYGASLYNTAVTLFVPAQIVGDDLKEGLILNIGTQGFGTTGHAPNTGSTLTGLSDAFASFWYFGAIKFFIIGLIFSRWFMAATQGHFTAQLIAILIAYQALIAFPFSTNDFFLRFVPLTIFILPVLFYARIRKRKPLRQYGIGIRQTSLVR